MAVAFACPGCATPFNVTEEMAGKRAKCPKCTMVFTLPSATPAPVAGSSRSKGASPVTDLFPDSGKSDPDRKRSKRSSRDDDYDDDRDRDRDRDRRDDRDEPRARKKSKRSKGSSLPWILAIVGVGVFLSLLCGGSIVVIAVVAANRQPNKAAVAVNNVAGPGNNPQVDNAGPMVNLRQGAGTKVNLVNGMFTTTNRLNPGDPVDPKEINCRCKLYQVDLQPGHTYTIEMDSNEFDAYLRLEDSNGGVLAENDDIQPGVILNSRIVFTPNRADRYVVVATTFNQNTFGAFTLRIRDNNPGAPPKK